MFRSTSPWTVEFLHTELQNRPVDQGGTGQVDSIQTSSAWTPYNSLTPRQEILAGLWTLGYWIETHERPGSSLNLGRYASRRLKVSTNYISTANTNYWRLPVSTYRSLLLSSGLVEAEFEVAILNAGGNEWKVRIPQYDGKWGPRFAQNLHNAIIFVDISFITLGARDRCSTSI